MQLSRNDSESSSIIQKNIKQTMYSAFPDLKNQQLTMGRLMDMQTKAQLDALKRFIKTMESDVVQNKRIA